MTQRRDRLIQLLKRGKHLLEDRQTTPRGSPWLGMLSALTLLLVLLEIGYQVKWGWGQTWLTRFCEFTLLVVYLVDIAVRLFRTPDKWEYLRQRPRNWFIAAGFLLVVAFPSVESLTALVVVILYREILLLLESYTKKITGHAPLAYLQLKPAQMLALSFFVTILVGGYLLTLPASTIDGQGAGWLEALFTSTSATCVTGLIVVDTATYWTRFGQIVILVLIQVGALGIMTLSSSAALIFGKRLGLRHRVVLQDIFDEKMAENLTQLVRYIIKLTLGIETVGALLLVFQFHEPGTGWPEAAYRAVFHSISAFCNAGFALYNDNLMGFVNDPGITLIVSTLIILGGLGYTVLAGFSLLRHLRRSLRWGWVSQSLHTKLVLTTTACLISLGTVLIFFLEFDNTLLHLPLKQKLAAAYFQSVTTRTAGFNTISFGQITQATLFLMVILMFIGASPGSTGGGVKTTTFTVLLLSVRSILQRREEVEAYGRSIPQQVVYKAAAVSVVSLALLLGLLFLLLLAESQPFLELAFEAVSAFSTVGLSTGLTPKLTVFGKLVIIIMMYTGRIGPLTLAIAIGEPKSEAQISFPEGRVLVG